jgi:glycosyltransferase involved in cell wall biosynthesis
MKLSGYIPVRNAMRLDYCLKEAINSLLPVCDEVVVCDSESDDGTWEMLMAWEEYEPRLKLFVWPWPNPVNCKQWFVEWLNYCRKSCRYDMQLQLDADEVLHEDGYEEIIRACEARECRWIKRLNFWGDTRYLAPSGYVCGDDLARLGPTELYMPSDEPHPEGEPEIRKRATRHPSLKTHHYGFIRRKEAFYEKSKLVHAAFHGAVDSRLTRCQETGEDWTQVAAPPVPLEPYHGTQPKVAHDWLLERGYPIST